MRLALGLAAFAFAVVIAAGCADRPLTSPGEPQPTTASTCAVDCGNGGEVACEPSPANGYRYCCEGFTPYGMTYGGVTHNVCVPCGGEHEPCCNAVDTGAPDWQGPTCERGLTCVVGDWTCH
jgi:hypothetical protein